MKTYRINLKPIFVLMLVLSTSIFAQIPQPALVGYWENWNSLKLTDLHENYNVIQLAFAVTTGESMYEMEFNLPYHYTEATFKADIETLHSEGKKVILSIGGANDPVFLGSDSERDTFVEDISAILSRFDYLIDGIDLDFEGKTTSFNFNDNWTMTSPAPGQIRMIQAVEAIMANYAQATSKHLLLTMAPEVPYLAGGLSQWGVDNSKGGAMLPILEGLIDSLDVIHPQFYNATEAYGLDGRIYPNYTVNTQWEVTDPTGFPSFVVAVTEAMIHGFTIKSGKGVFQGVPQEKFAIGLPASECDQWSSGWLPPAEAVNAVKYLKGDISQPASVSYTLQETYPNLAGLMTWSINEDSYSTGNRSGCSRTPWEFANNFTNMFGELTTSLFNESSLRKVEDLGLTIQSATMYFNSSFHGQRLRIYNPQGQNVLQSQIAAGGLDLQSLPQGRYFVQVNGVSAGFRIQ